MIKIWLSYLLKRKSLFEFGYSVIEMLVVAGVFATIGVIITNSLAFSFKNSKKTSAISNVKSEISYAASTIERVLRNARGIKLPSDPLYPSSPTKLYYVDEKGDVSFFECVSGGTSSYIASGSAGIRLTGNSVVMDCSSVFSYPDGGNVVDIALKGYDKTFGSGEEGASVSVKTRIIIRNYAF
jgi:hypothetical protein